MSKIRAHVTVHKVALDYLSTPFFLLSLSRIVETSVIPLSALKICPA